MELTSEKIKSIDDPYLFEDLCCHILLLNGYMVSPQAPNIGQTDGGKDAIDLWPQNSYTSRRL